MILDLQATPEEVIRAVETLQEFGEKREMPMKTLFGLTVALEEMGSNIVNYALEGDASRQFSVRIEQTGSTLVIELRDAGPEFDVTKVPEREPCEEDDDGPEGGWGIQLARRYTDEMVYRRDGEENVLRLIKELG